MPCWDRSLLLCLAATEGTFQEKHTHPATFCGQAHKIMVAVQTQLAKMYTGPQIHVLL